MCVQRTRLAQGAGFKLNAGGKCIAAILKFGAKNEAVAPTECEQSDE